jgi:ubiquinone/menaquinone biosynthesis C-methylase UbiE
MSQPLSVSPLAKPRLWNLVADTYCDEIAPWLAKYAEDALRLAEIKPDMLIADVACGPGDLSLAAARGGARARAVDFSSEMIACLRQRALDEGCAAVEAQIGDGMALPFADGGFDCAFSMFGLIFFPDRAQGFRELKRILKPQGRAVVASWVPFGRVAVLDDIYRTLGELLPSLPFNAQKAPLGEAAGFRREMTEAGFREVTVHEVSHVREVPSVDAYWNMLARSTPPLHAVREAVGQERWTEVVRQLLASLREKWGTGPQTVQLIANLAVGRR